MSWLRTGFIACIVGVATVFAPAIAHADDIDVPAPPPIPQIDIPGVYDPGAINPNISVTVPQVGCDDPQTASAMVGCPP